MTIVTNHGDSATVYHRSGVPKPHLVTPKGSLPNQNWWFCTPACRQSSSQLLAGRATGSILCASGWKKNRRWK